MAITVTVWFLNTGIVGLRPPPVNVFCTYVVAKRRLFVAEFLSNICDTNLNFFEP